MRLLPIALLSLLLALIALADVTGTISGVITDQSGAVISSAEVTVTNAGTNATFRARSTDEGVFTLNALPIGVYNLTVSNRGFKRFEARNIRLQVNEIVRADVPLSVGETAET